MYLYIYVQGVKGDLGMSGEVGDKGHQVLIYIYLNLILYVLGILTSTMWQARRRDLQNVKNQCEFKH